MLLVRIDLVEAVAIFFMFCRTDCYSLFKILSLSTEIQFSTDLAQMNTQPQCIKVDDATQMITEVYLDVQKAVRGNFEPSHFG